MRSFLAIATSAIVAHNSTTSVVASRKDTPRPEQLQTQENFSFRRGSAPTSLQTVYEPHAPSANDAESRTPQRPAFGNKSKTRNVSRNHNASDIGPMPLSAIDSTDIGVARPAAQPKGSQQWRKSMDKRGETAALKAKEQAIKANEQAQLRVLKERMHQDTPRYGRHAQDRKEQIREGVCNHMNHDVPYQMRMLRTGTVAAKAGIIAAARSLAEHDLMKAHGHSFVDYANFDADARLPEKRKIVFSPEKQKMREQLFGSEYKKKMSNDVELQSLFENRLEQLDAMKTAEATGNQIAAFQSKSFLSNKPAAWVKPQELPKRRSFKSWNEGRESGSPRGSTEKRAQMLRSMSARSAVSRSAVEPPTAISLVSSDDESVSSRRSDADLCTPTNQTPSISGSERTVEGTNRVASTSKPASGRMVLSPNSLKHYAVQGLVGLASSGNAENCESPRKVQRRGEGKENDAVVARLGL